ncbi:demethylmenaquinone methyltransferase / 2-methoxy-6-polyprenyl-1,4-benzoquinol methylase [Catalinimonas alkaloidigena]|uniref:Demethylmenaquinone methyltransferase n=1 Tax=Catalinimonas alkaloidigena TaxID=1075417 RepID=A0A1G8WKD2_9BACT|nr:bifunctional demethylmenaquinone methyltransferase/2-methoxy-6-polyprenyl-1,4-benzoquinol methylase UbiE [Catalinimonas alkaloidigena]SDJ78828.1 demethylmenaquinone methyltransferase / 2-methoxy-6-polyprenyl-1,4-benzoquinol methylase [Catalinimonas alkaloidigena]
MAVVPYKERTSSKKQQVADMFDSISHRYDFLNHFLSFGIDILWRKRAIGFLQKYRPQLMLDVATGTGDFALEAYHRLKPQKIIGVDISEGMLSLGRDKMKARGLADRIEMQLGDSEKLLFDDNYFDAVTVAFGVRNFENLELGLQELYRVLKPGGVVVILEFSKPHTSPVREGYELYSEVVVPRIGQLISRDPAAYTYLPESVRAFPEGFDFLRILDSVGFRSTVWKPLTFGIASVYKAQKRG